MSKKTPKQAHTSPTQRGSGDYYGTGKRNPVGRQRELMLTPIKKKETNKSPRSLA